MNFDGSAVITAVTAVMSLSSGAVVLYQRATAADLRLLIEQTRNAIIEHINGKYVRKEQCPFRDETVNALLDLLQKDKGIS